MLFSQSYLEENRISITEIYKKKVCYRREPLKHFGIKSNRMKLEPGSHTRESIMPPIIDTATTAWLATDRRHIIIVLLLRVKDELKPREMQMK